MNNLPLVSVIMPVYNAELYLKESVESILNQTYTNFEFIIMDDCSTDNSYQILQSYANLDNRIKLFKNQKNLRQAGTRNLAIKMARGQYIAIMDADDISLPERFGCQVKFMEANSAIDVLGSYALAFNSKTKRQQLMKVQLKHKLIKAYMLFISCNLLHPTVMIRRNIIIKHNLFYNEALGGLAEDYELWIRMLKQGIIMANLNQVLVKYRLSTTQTTNLLKTQIEDYSQELIHNNLKELFGNSYNLKLCEKHQFYVQRANFFKNLISYWGFINYQHQFIKANLQSKVLNFNEIKLLFNELNPIYKLVR